MKEDPTHAAPDLETADPETDRQHAPARSRVHVIAGSRAARTGGQDLVDRDRSWRFEYLSPVTGKKAVLSLPAGTLAEARVIAKSHRALVALGRDPALEAEADLEARREAQSKAVTVASRARRL